MDDIYKDESEFGQNSERSLNDELSDLPMSLDPNLSNHLCSACGAQCLDIGLESGDRFCRPRRWFKCPTCNNLDSIIVSQ